MDDVSSARQALHAVAELLLAGPQWRATGQLALAVTATGFSTTHAPAPGIDSLAVDGGEVVAQPSGARTAIEGSIRSMAQVLGVEPGAPALYADHAELGVDDPLPGRIGDGAALGVVLSAFADGDAALRLLDPEQTPILWPEHFDVGIAVGEVNYGVSPSDAGHDRPYAYVGPWTPREGAFWNEPFGAARPVDDLGGAEGILAFFIEGRDLTQR